MTQRRAKEYLGAALTAGLIILIFEMATSLSGEISKGVGEGLVLAVKRVIPTTLPFIIISDLFLTYARPEYIPFLPRIFKAVYSLPEVCLGSVLVGSICGFPIGARLTSETYLGGALDKGDAERCLAYSSTPSPAFVIGVVGGGMLGDVRLGILLLISIYSGVIVSAQFFRRKGRTFDNCRDIIGQKFNFVESVKGAAISSLTVAAFISIFNLVSAFALAYIPFEWLKNLIVGTLEVTSAAEYFAKEYGENLILKTGLIGFSLGFGGISVLCQSAAFASKARLSMKPYFFIKIISGLLTGCIAALLTYFIY